MRPPGGPWANRLECSGGAEHKRVLEATSHDLEPDGQAAGRPAGWDGDGRLAAVGIASG